MTDGPTDTPPQLIATLCACGHPNGRHAAVPPHACEALGPDAAVCPCQQFRPTPRAAGAPRGGA